MKMRTPIQRSEVSRWLFYLANIVLIVDTLRLRFSRVTKDQSPYFSPSFIVFLIAVVGTTALVTWLVHKGFIFVFFDRFSTGMSSVISMAIVVGGYILIVTMQQLLPQLIGYDPPLVKWLGISAIALLIYVIDPSSGRAYTNYLLLGISIILPLILLDIGLRYWFTNFGTESDRVRYLYTPDEIRTTRFALSPAPYVNYKLTADYEPRSHNSLGYRGPEFSESKPDGVYRIVIFGGSTTYGYRLSDWQDT